MAEQRPGHLQAPRHTRGPQMSCNTLPSTGTPCDKRTDRNALRVDMPGAQAFRSMGPTRQGQVSGRKRAEWAARGLEGAPGIPSLVLLFVSKHLSAMHCHWAPVGHTWPTVGTDSETHPCP